MSCYCVEIKPGQNKQDLLQNCISKIIRRYYKDIIFVSLPLPFPVRENINRPLPTEATAKSPLPVTLGFMYESNPICGF